MTAATQEAIDGAKKFFHKPVSQNSQRNTSGNSGQFDVAAYLDHYGISYKIKSNGASTLYCLDHCIFDDSHTGNESAIIQQAGGMLLYQCFHNSCKNHTWKEARQIISGDEKLRAFMVGNEQSSPPSINAIAILIKEAEADPGAPYKHENLKTLAALKKSDLGQFMSLRNKLKGLKCNVTQLDKAIDEDSKGDDGQGGGGHLAIAQVVVTSYGVENILHSQGFTWKWNGRGVWEKRDDREIKGKIHKIAGKGDLTRGVVDSILDMVKTEIFRADHRFDIDRTTINCLNGELHWTDKGWELREHKRENYRTTQIPVAYDPKAKAPRFEQFLIEIFQDDSDRDEKASLICEVTGYSLLSACVYEKFIMLIGPGANGKSVLMDIVAAMVGQESVAAVQPNQLRIVFREPIYIAS